MTKYNLTRNALLHIAPILTSPFDVGAEFSEKNATDGVPKVLVVRNPHGNGTPYISMRFPGDLLDRYDRLSDVNLPIFEMRFVSELMKIMPKYEEESRSGNLKPDEAFVIEFDDRLFDGL